MRAFFRALPLAALLAGSAGWNAPDASAQVQLSLRLLAPVEAMYVPDLLPGSANVRPDLLGITLVSQGEARPIVLELTVARESPSPVQIFRGTTDPFVIEGPVRHLTSRDLAAGGEFAITDHEVNADAADDGPGSGRFPAGTYLFTVTLRSPEGAVLDHDEVRLTLGSASRVDLLSPGIPADAGTPPIVPGPTPRFLWSADGEAAGPRYRLRVVRVEGDQSAVEAVQSGFPVWETVTSATSALYPASAQALRLEPGATYAWHVTRELSTSGGGEPVESAIYWFRLDGAGGTGAVDAQFAALLRALGLSPELDGFTPVGATLEDGRVIPLQALQELLAAIAAGEIAVLSVGVR
jgi:hypothetical protein